MSKNFSKLTFDQIKVGMTKEFHIDITQKLVDDFTKINRNFCLIHVNDEYPKSTKFDK